MLTTGATIQQGNHASKVSSRVTLALPDDARVSQDDLDSPARYSDMMAPPRLWDPEGTQRLRFADTLQANPTLLRSGSPGGQDPDSSRPFSPDGPSENTGGIMLSSSFRRPQSGSGGIAPSSSFRRQQSSSGIAPSPSFKQQQSGSSIAPSSSFRRQQSGSGIAPSSSFRRQQSGSGIAPSSSFKMQQSSSGGIAPSSSLRRQASGGGGLAAVVAPVSIGLSDGAPAGSSNSHVLSPYGDGMMSYGSRSVNGAYDRISSARRSGSSTGDVRRRGGWLRRFSCFGGGSVEQVGYQGQDDLALMEKQKEVEKDRQRKELRKSNSQRLTKALSGTFTGKNGRVATPPGAGEGASNPDAESTGVAPGSPRSAGGRKAQPILSLQPQKSILKSSSLKRRVTDSGPILIKVASARIGGVRQDLTGFSNGAAGMVDSITGTDDGGEVVSLLAGSSMQPSIASVGVPPVGPRDDGDDTVLLAPANGGERGTSMMLVAAEVLDAMEEPLSPGPSGILYGSDKSPNAVSPSTVMAGRWVPPGVSALSSVKGSTAASVSLGWVQESPGYTPGSGNASSAASGGGGGAGTMLHKSASLQRSANQGQLAGVGAHALLTAGMEPASSETNLWERPVPGSGGGRTMTLSLSGLLPQADPGEVCRPSLVQRMMTRQLSRGHGGGGGSSVSLSGAICTTNSGGGGLPMGRLAARNAIRPLPPLLPGAGGWAAEEPLAPSLPPQPSPPLRAIASLRRSVAGCESPAVGVAAVPSSPASYLDYPRRRLTASGKISKLAAGIGSLEPSDENCYDDSFYGKSERMTAPARQLMGLMGSLAAVEVEEALSPSQCRVPREVLTVDLTADATDRELHIEGGGGGSGEVRHQSRGVSDSSRWRPQVVHAMKDRTDVPYSPSGSSLPAQPRTPPWANTDGGYPEFHHLQVDSSGGAEVPCASPGTWEQLVPQLIPGGAVVAVEVGDGGTRPLPQALQATRRSAPDGGGEGNDGDSRGGGSRGGGALSSSSSSSSMEGCMTSVAASVGATAGAPSHLGDLNDEYDRYHDEDGDDDIEKDAAAASGMARSGGEGEHGVGQQMDSLQARQMVKVELLRMQSMGIEPRLHKQLSLQKQPLLNVEDGSTFQAANTPGVLDSEGRGDAAAAPTPADATGVALELKSTDSAPLAEMRFRLTKFHSVGRRPRVSDSEAAGLGLAVAGEAGLPLTAAMLRASAAAVLDNARHVSSKGGGACLMNTATATAITAATAYPTAVHADAKAPPKFAPLFIEAPSDTLETWVQHHSRRWAGERVCAGPLGPLDPLDELSEVTDFKGDLGVVAAPPLPRKQVLSPPAESPAPAQELRPFLWGTGSRSLQRGACLNPDPKVVQMWLQQRNEREAELSLPFSLQQQQLKGGGVNPAVEPVVKRQSMPGSLRSGAKQ